MSDLLATEINRWLRANGFPGERLRALRLKYRLTQQDVASAVGCSDNIVSRIERDEQQFRDVEDLLRFTAALGCTELEKAELIASYLFTHTRISLWIACRLLMEHPDNPIYQKSFSTALNTILCEDRFAQEQKQRKNQNAKRRRLQPTLASLTAIFIVVTAAAITLPALRVSLQFAESSTTSIIPIVIPTSAPAILFEDDFESGDLSQWVNPGSIGHVVQEGDQRYLRLENHSDSFVIFRLDRPRWANATAEAWVRVVHSSPKFTDFFLNIRDNPEGSYSGGLDADSATATLLATINGNFATLGTKVVDLHLNQWVKVGLRAVADRIDFFYNDVLIRTATDGYHLAGTLSFSVAPQTRIDVGQIRVTGG